MKYQAVIFDLDGTLLNSIPDIESIVNSILLKQGIAPKTTEQITAAVGFGVEHLLRNCGVPETDISRLSAVVAGEYSSITNSEAVLYDGIKEMLFAVEKLGYKIFVLSNKPHDGLEKSISDHLSFFNFQSFKGSKLGRPAKPEPDVLLEMLLDFGISPDAAVISGDGEPDVLVAEAAKIDVLSVLWGYRSRSALESAGASRFIESPEEILTFLHLAQ